MENSPFLKIMIKFLRKYYLSLIFILFVIMPAAYMRLYRISEYLTFLGDEGRDVLVVKRMLIDGKFTLLGPITSVGSIYMGPVYYYLMAPFLYLWNFDPTGPAVLVALLSLATVFFIYRIGREFFSPLTGLAASFLYAISPLTVIYGRSSWNPNIVPFFATLYMYCLMKAVLNKEYRWLTGSGLALGILIQLHYVAFMFFIITPFVFLVFKRLPSWRYLIYFIISFFIAWSPFILFELRHSFINTQGAWRFFWQQSKEAKPGGIVRIYATINDVTVRLFWRLVIIRSAELTKIFLVILTVVAAYTFKSKSVKYRAALKFLLIWLLTGIFSFGLYRGVIYDYYLGSLFALPFLFSGLLISSFFRSGITGRLSALSLLAILSYFNIMGTPLRLEPNNMLKNTREISAFVFEKTAGKPYNFALIAGRNSDHAYRYFLELWGSPPNIIENPQVDPKRNTVTQQLLIVCEEKICQPLGHPLWEIAGFGQAEITGEWQVSTAKVFRLIHYDG